MGYMIGCAMRYCKWVMQPQPQSNDNRINRSRDFQASTKSSDKEIMETFVYMGFFHFQDFC